MEFYRAIKNECGRSMCTDMRDCLEIFKWIRQWFRWYDSIFVEENKTMHMYIYVNKCLEKYREIHIKLPIVST